MYKYLENKGKFWEIRLSGSDYIVRYGKVGAKGRTLNKTFSSATEARVEAEKQIKAKLDKGYLEVSQSTLTAITELTALHRALCDHFAYLADSPGYEKVLSAIMEDAYDVIEDGEDLVVKFRGNKELRASPPADSQTYQLHPKSYQRCVAMHESLSFPDGYTLHLGGSDIFEAEYLTAVQSELLEHISEDEAICALGDYADWWLYHPGHSNLLDEPSLCFFSHDGGDLEPPETIPIGSLFLRRMASIQDLTIEFPDSAMDDASPMSWWNSLSEDWQKALKDHARLNEDEEVNERAVKNILNMESFACHEQGLSLMTLDPLTALQKCSSISISRQPKLQNLTPLTQLSRLYSISISQCAVKDLSPLAQLKRLEFLDLDELPIEDLAPLSSLKKLKRIEIASSKVSDLSALKNFKNLEDLKLQNTPLVSLNSLPELPNLRSIDISKTSITSLEPLKNYPRLGDISIDDTKIEDLSPLDSNTQIFIFHCRRANVSFTELLRFFEARYESFVQGESISLYCDFLNSAENLTLAIERLEKAPAQANILAAWVNLMLKQCIKYKWFDKAEHLLRAYLQKSSESIDEELQQILFASVVPLLSFKNTPSLEEQVFHHLFPTDIDDGELAFTLSGMYALRSDKEKMLSYATKAMMLGVEPARFRDDESFAVFYEDSDFVSELEAPHCPNPHEDAYMWWCWLDEDWQDVFYYAVPDGITSKKCLQKVFAIEELRLHQPANLEPLRYLTNLKKIHIQFSKLSGLDPIENLTFLEEFTLEASDHEKNKIKSVEPLSKLTKLKCLCLQEQAIEDLSPLSSCMELEELKLVRLPATSIEAFVHTTKLKKIEIQLMNFEDINAIQHNTALKSLSLSSCKNVSYIGVLENMRDLEVLNLSGTNVTDITVLSHCRNLQYLRASYPLTSLAALEALDKLVELTLPYDTTITHAEIEDFKRKHSKCDLDLS